MVSFRSRRTSGSLSGVAALGATLAFSTAADAAQTRIYGGGATPPGAYPFHAFVQTDIGQCGGSLVAARYVVTAGHCVEGTSDTAELAIGVDTVPRSDVDAVPPEHRYTASVIRHPGYRHVPVPVLGTGAPVNDVAVLRLDRPAAFAQLRVPRPGDAPLWAPGVVGTAIGFGETERGGTSERLLQVQLPIVGDAECSDVYGDAYRPEGNVCAGYAGPSGKDTCGGDSGGPLLVPDGFGAVVLGATTSFGQAECGESYGAYAEIGAPEINDFLRSVVPQVEVDASTGTPVEGDEVRYTATPRDPDGSGPFGGYDAIAWDLDGDGTFAEALGTTAATTVARPGPNRVSVRASDAVGNAEVRTIHVRGLDAARVTFERRRVVVQEGRTLALRIVKARAGAGSIEVRPSRAARRRLRSARPVTVTLPENGRARTVRFRTRDDRRRRRARTFKVRLVNPTGVVRPGRPKAVRVRVRDDDA